MKNKVKEKWVKCKCNAGFGAPDVFFKAVDCPIHGKSPKPSKDKVIRHSNTTHYKSQSCYVCEGRKPKYIEQVTHIPKDKPSKSASISSLAVASEQSKDKPMSKDLRRDIEKIVKDVACYDFMDMPKEDLNFTVNRAVKRIMSLLSGTKTGSNTKYSLLTSDTTECICNEYDKKGLSACGIDCPIHKPSKDKPVKEDDFFGENFTEEDRKINRIRNTIMNNYLNKKAKKLFNKPVKVEGWEERFDEEFLKYYPDGSYRFLRSVYPDDIISFISKLLSEQEKRIIKIFEKFIKKQEKNYGFSSKNPYKEPEEFSLRLGIDGGYKNAIENLKKLVKSMKEGEK